MYLSYVIVNIKEVLYYIVINVWYLAMSDNQKDPQYKLRWSEELRDKVMLSAKEQNRSINQEIVARLEKSFESDGINPNELISEVIGLNRLVDRLDETINILNERLKSLESKTPN